IRLLRIPAADGSRLPVFRSVFADIGDEQSIDASLSTFSGHIMNIAAMDRGLVTPALVLLDEVGSGTDPIEGGALGVAMVDPIWIRLLRIPAADGSRLPVFRSVFADIGDEQSIDASLSTFSGHIMNIAAMDRGLVTPALVLLDEVGSGTDPIEGGALGVAMVD